MKQFIEKSAALKEMDLRILRELEVIKKGHFILRSRDHTDTYFAKRRLYRKPALTSRFAKEIALEFFREKIDVVVGPEIGGIILAQWVAYHLAGLSLWPVEMVLAEKDKDKGFIFKEGTSEFLKGKNVLIVDDIVTTGSSLRKLFRAVKRYGGKPIGIAVICDRGKIRKIGAISILSLLRLKLKTSPEDNCPLCKDNVPISSDYGRKP